jgi:hypothetical protein
MNQKITRLLTFLACAAVLSLFTAAASPTPTCLDGQTLAYYITTYGSAGCQIGDKIFSDFGYTGGNGVNGGNTVTSSAIMVNTLGAVNDPTNPGGGASTFFPNDIGLSFNGSWVAPVAGSSSDGTISFQVAVAVGGAFEITDAGLVQSGGVTGTGFAQTTEAGCSGVNCSVQQWGIVSTQTTNSNAFLAHTFLAPTGVITVTKDIGAIAFSNGTASISDVQDLFSQTAVPEPRAISMLLGLALFAGLAFKKLQAARS